MLNALTAFLLKFKIDITLLSLHKLILVDTVNKNNV